MLLWGIVLGLIILGTGLVLPLLIQAFCPHNQVHEAVWDGGKSGFTCGRVYICQSCRAELIHQPAGSVLV